MSVRRRMDAPLCVLCAITKVSAGGARWRCAPAARQGGGRPGGTASPTGISRKCNRNLKRQKEMAGLEASARQAPSSSPGYMPLVDTSILWRTEKGRLVFAGGPTETILAGKIALLIGSATAVQRSFPTFTVVAGRATKAARAAPLLSNGRRSHLHYRDGVRSESDANTISTTTA